MGVMKLELDLERIERCAERDEKRNVEFRFYLKSCGLSSKKIDAMVHSLNDEIAVAIDCGKCANCCVVGYPVLKPPDVTRLAQFLKLSEEAFREKYLQKDDEGRAEVFRLMPCPFLHKNRCEVYAARPEDCRSFPHLHKDDFVSRLSRVVDNCSMCPIVFNVYERLKEKLWRGRGGNARR